MRKLLLIALIVSQLTGCPSVMYGNLKNESTESLIVYRPDDFYVLREIRPGSKEEIPWYQECNIIISGQEKKYYTGRFSVPPEAVQINTFSVSTDLIYRGNELFFATPSGDLIPAPTVTKCGRPN
jgi:hypothetical protein